QRVSAFVGPSGVGKSSLLNAIQPGLAQRVSSVGATTHKGRHTTTGSRLFALDGPLGGYIADTAGFRALGFFDGTIDRLDMCFREFRPYLGACRLGDCRHLSEPGCAIREATRTGEVAPARYESYRRLASGTDGAPEGHGDALDELEV
ncbi:MAG TPA: ribosome small subunit-dependent GTPase A, partial [Ktedonobacterales bacterium]